MKILITSEEQNQISKTLCDVFDVEYIDQLYPDQEIELTFKTHPDTNPFFGLQHAEVTRKHLSTVQSTKIGKLNQFYGKKHRPEVIESNKQKNIEILTKLKGKKVNQYDLNGNFIQTHESVRSAARNIGVKHYNQISKCCRGIVAYSYGYLWKYA